MPTFGDPPPLSPEWNDEYTWQKDENGDYKLTPKIEMEVEGTPRPKVQFVLDLETLKK